MREECLDELLILGQHHLRRVIREYVAFYNQLRPHQGLDQQAPLSAEWSGGEGAVGRRDILGGIITATIERPRDPDFFRELGFSTIQHQSRWEGLEENELARVQHPAARQLQHLSCSGCGPFVAQIR